MTVPKSTLLALMLALSAFGATEVAQAQFMDSESIIRALTPKPRFQAPRTRGFGQQGLSRGYRPNTGLGRGISIEGGQPKPKKPPSVNLQVHFEFDSSRLTNDAMITLAALGKALQDKRLASMRFKIIGHTDSVGSDADNMLLSRKRAEAVRARLTQFHNIVPDRLMTEGHGERELINPTHPEAAINRRVQIVNLGGPMN